MGLAASQFFLPVTRALLTVKPSDRMLEVFGRLGVPKSPGYRILTFYEVHNAVQTVPSRLAVDVRKVIALAGGLRADRAVPNRALASGPPLDVTLEILKEAELHYALGFQSAANQHAFFEPAGIHQLYVQKRKHEHTDHLHLARLSRELADHPQASPRQRYEFFLDDLTRLDILERPPREPVTNPLQTLLDLAVHARMAAHLEFMLTFLEKQGVLHA